MQRVDSLFSVNGFFEKEGLRLYKKEMQALQPEIVKNYKQQIEEKQV